MEELEEDQQPTVNFVPCLCFVKRGIAKDRPEKITLTQDELARVIQDTKRELDEDDDEDEENDAREAGAMDTSDNEEVDPNRNPNDEFNFDNYDNEIGVTVAGIADIAVIDPNERLDDNEDEDSEAEDDIIKPEDNLILVGHVEDDSACLEVYVYNEEEGSLYVHHDFILPTLPLCIEWMNYDPDTKEAGNMCAIGGMDPIITVWDLDIQDSLEPAVKLGKKPSRKKGIERVGHSDAVLDLSWNPNFPHILASGSVDQTVLLWDLDESVPHTTLTSFHEKVQTIQFHPTEPHHLLTGCCDGIVRLFDCRDPETVNTLFKSWNLNSEIERICWDPIDTNRFLASTNNGQVVCIDVRQEAQLWAVEAHSKEVTGLSLNPKGVLATASADGELKLWEYNAIGATLLQFDDMKIGQIQCMAPCPENPFAMALGGDFRKKHFRVVDALTYDSVKRKFATN